MRFNADIYEKVFPKTEAPKVVESAVDTFKPTEEKAMDHQPGVKKDDQIEPPASVPDNQGVEPSQPEEPEGESHE